MIVNKFLQMNVRVLEKFTSEFNSKTSTPCSSTAVSVTTTTTTSTTSFFSPKSSVNDFECVAGLMNYFNGVEELSNALSVVGIALAMRKILYSAYHECNDHHDSYNNEHEASGGKGG